MKKATTKIWVGNRWVEVVPKTSAKAVEYSDGKSVYDVLEPLKAKVDNITASVTYDAETESLSLGDGNISVTYDAETESLSLGDGTTSVTYDAETESLSLGSAIGLSTLVHRNSNGSITVPETPIADTDAASKAYVEEYCDSVETSLETNFGNTKLDKNTAKSDYNQVYAKTDAGNQVMVDISRSTLAGAIVQRRVDSQIRVPEEPIHNQDATSKAYVDTKVGQIDMVSCMYYDIAGGTQTKLKGEGYYMVYSNNADLRLCKSNGSVVVSGAKQMQFMVAVQDKYPTGNYKACGQYWTGSSLSGVEGFRMAVDRTGYIYCPTDYTICVMYKI